MQLYIANFISGLPLFIVIGWSIVKWQTVNSSYNKLNYAKPEAKPPYIVFCCYSPCAWLPGFQLQCGMRQKRFFQIIHLHCESGWINSFSYRESVRVKLTINSIDHSAVSIRLPKGLTVDRKDVAKYGLEPLEFNFVEVFELRIFRHFLIFLLKLCSEMLQI